MKTAPQRPGKDSNRTDPARPGSPGKQGTGFCRQQHPTPATFTEPAPGTEQLSLQAAWLSVLLFLLALLPEEGTSCTLQSSCTPGNPEACSLPWPSSSPAEHLPGCVTLRAVLETSNEKMKLLSLGFLLDVRNNTHGHTGPAGPHDLGPGPATTNHSTSPQPPACGTSKAVPFLSRALRLKACSRTPSSAPLH